MRILRQLLHILRLYSRLSWLRLQIWRIPLTLKLDLWLASKLRLGSRYHFWRAGRMMGMPRLDGESVDDYGLRLMRKHIEDLKR